MYVVKTRCEDSTSDQFSCSVDVASGRTRGSYDTPRLASKIVGARKAASRSHIAGPLRERLAIHPHPQVRGPADIPDLAKLPVHLDHPHHSRGGRADDPREVVHADGAWGGAGPVGRGAWRALVNVRYADTERKQA